MSFAASHTAASWPIIASSFLIADHKKLVWHPGCGPDLAEFSRDLAPGCAGILGDVDLTEQAERHNAVGVGGMRGKAPHSRIGLGLEWQDLPGLPEVCGAPDGP